MSNANPTLFAGRYEIQQLVGKGGKGIVYRAVNRPMQRIVAIKLLAAGPFATAVEVARFRREAEALAFFHHLNIVSIHEVGEAEGQPYITLQLVESNLAQWLQAATMRLALWPPTEVVQILVQVARAVDHIHQRGILHRNIKPTSILLDLSRYSGEPLRPYLASFGLACPHSAVFGQGFVVGTPAYISPEQGAGSTSLSPASDVWSLGVILYEALTGHLPFVGATPGEIIARAREMAPDPPRSINPKVPRDLETIVLKCLHKVPERRYAAAADLADDLDRWLSMPATVGRPGVLTRLRRWWTSQQS